MVSLTIPPVGLTNYIGGTMKSIFLKVEQFQHKMGIKLPEDKVKALEESYTESLNLLSLYESIENEKED